MNVTVRGRVLRALLALPLLLLPALGHASGFALESQGARAMGFSGAYVAQADDPSAIYYNAAGIGFLKGKHLYVGAFVGGLSTDFTGEGPYPAAGTLESSDRGLGLLPTLYYSQQVGERLYVGVGFNRPFGFKSSWENPDQFTGRYICIECELGAWGLNPTVAWRVEDRLAIGAGLDLRFASFKTVRRLQASPNPFPVPTDVAQYTLDGGTDTGVGFNVGILASPTEDFSIGLSYRHKVAAEHAAQASFVQILTGNTDGGRCGRPVPAREPGGDGHVHLPGHRRRGGGPAPGVLDDRGGLPVDPVVELRPGGDHVPGAPRPSTTSCPRTTRARGAAPSASST